MKSVPITINIVSLNPTHGEVVFFGYSGFLQK